MSPPLFPYTTLFRSLLALHEVVEGDRVEGAPAARHLHPHLHVPCADQPCAADAEQPVETRLGERLPPRAAGAQRLGGIERDLLGRELAVGLDRIPGAGARAPAGHFLVEGARKAIEAGALERQPRRHGVTAESMDEIGVARGDE